MDASLALPYVVEPGLRHLPARMDTPEARAMLLAIGLQESNWEHRAQVGGPARGFYQFERAGVQGVMTHSWTWHEAEAAAVRLAYEPDSATVHAAIEHNDALATVFARLLLWTLPTALPRRGEVEEAWNQYLDAWRPGRPHPERWPDNFKQAWRIVEA